MSTRHYTGTAFFSRNIGNYRKLWQIIGRDWTDLATEAAWAVENIPGAHHGDLKIELSSSQRSSMLPVLTDMEFFDAATFPPGSFDELSVSGAKFNGMLGRWRDLRMLLDTDYYRFRRVTCLYGVRLRRDELDGTLEEIIESIPVGALGNPWVHRELGLDVPFQTEWHLGILAVIIAYNGDVAVYPYEPSGDTTHLPDVPFREAAAVTLRLPDDTRVLALNCPAIKRPGKASAPTTDSTTQYWLEHYPPVPNATVAMVFGPTHWYRQASTAEARIQGLRPDIELFAISRPAPDADRERLLPNALAEAVWLLKQAAAAEVGE